MSRVRRSLVAVTFLFVTCGLAVGVAVEVAVRVAVRVAVGVAVGVAAWTGGVGTGDRNKGHLYWDLWSRITVNEAAT